MTRAGTVAAVVAFALSRGVAISEIQDATGINCQELMNPEARLPEEVMPQLWLLLSNRFPQAPISLEMAKAASFSILGGLAEGAQYADDLRTAIDLFITNCSIIADRLELQLRITESETALTRYHPVDEIDGGRGAEMATAVAVRFLHEFLGVEDCVAGVRFAHAPHCDVEHYTTYFGVPIEFEATETALLIRPEKLSARIKYANAALFQYVKTHFARLQQQLAATSQGSIELASLRRAIAQNALAGEYRAAAAAAAANMSLRSAQRLTAEHGQSLQRLIDQVREDQAKEFLSDSNIDLNSVSLLVGYSDDRAFRRAFQRWTGQSPSKYRDELTS